MLQAHKVDVIMQKNRQSLESLGQPPLNLGSVVFFSNLECKGKLDYLFDPLAVTFLQPKSLCLLYTC